MFYRVITLAFLLVALGAPDARAESLEEALAGCQNTAEFTPHSYPGVVLLGPTNNLRRREGSSFVATGKTIFIKGKVLDEHCAPVTNAKVEMWQTDSNGNYLKLPDEDADFSGSGRTYTNNLGEYSFITVMPGKPKDGGATHVNFNINTGYRGKFSTRMYFPDNPDNAKDDDFKDATKQANALGVKMTRPGKDDIYFYNIKLPGK